MATPLLKQFGQVLGTIVADYSRLADRECREAVRDPDNPEKVISAREALARHDTAEEIRELLESHNAPASRIMRRANAQKPRKRK